MSHTKQKTKKKIGNQCTPKKHNDIIVEGPLAN